MLTLLDKTAYQSDVSIKKKSFDRSQKLFASPIKMRSFLALLCVLFIVLKSTNGEVKIVEETSGSDARPKDCNQNVFAFMKETAKTVWQNEIMPGLQRELNEKDQKIAQSDLKIIQLERDLNKVLQDSKPKVIFEARKTDGSATACNGYIRFNEFSLNVGLGMNVADFKAPSTGFYRFSFSAVTGGYGYSGPEDGGNPSETTVYVQKNGSTQFEILDGNDAHYGTENNLAHTWIWSLTKGETVSFYVATERHGYASTVRCSKTHPVIFTGELVYQD